MIELILIFVLILALYFIFKSMSIDRDIKSIREKWGIPEEKIIYTDLDRPAEPLFSEDLRLVGKPDYIVKVKNRYVPIEIKLTDTTKPFVNHIFQLATYCLLLEYIYNMKVPYGVLIYNDGRQHKILFDEDLRLELDNLFKEIRKNIGNDTVERNHNFPRRCISCPLRNNCDQKIA